jgi:YVTN family beta-propeller protein
MVDTQSRAVVATKPAGTSPESVVISPDGKNVYITAAGCAVQPCASFVEVIDTTTNAITATIPLGNSTSVQLSGIAIRPDGSRVYVACGSSNQVWAIDSSTNSIVATIHTTNSDSADLSISPDGSHIYTVGWTLGPFVASILADVIDTRTNAQTATVLLGNQDEPVRMAITPDGGRAYVTGDAGHVWVVDTTLNARMSTITVSSGNALNGVAFTPGGTRAYVTSGKINTIFVMDTAAGDVIGSVASNDPAGLAISDAN